MTPSEIEEYSTELLRQESEDKYFHKYWLMTHACTVLLPDMKEGETLSAESFIGKPPWEHAEEPVEATTDTPEEEDLTMLAVSKGLIPPGMITQAT